MRQKAQTQKDNMKRNIMLGIMTLLLLIVIFAVSFAMSDGIRESLEDSAYISLMTSSEIIRQNIDSEMQADLTLASSFGQMIYNIEDARLSEELEMLCNVNGLLHAYYADTSGIGIDESGAVFDIKSLPVAETALQGEISISPSYVGETGQQQILYQTPIYNGENVVGGIYIEVVATRYFHEEIFTFFDGEARACLFNRADGSFAIIAPQTKLAYLKTDSIYETIRLSNEDASAVDDFIAMVHDGKKIITRLQNGETNSFIAILPCRTAESYYVATIINQDELLRESNTIAMLILLMQIVMAMGFIFVLGLVLVLFYRSNQLQQQEKARELKEIYEEISRARDRRLSDIVVQEYEVQDEINLDTMEYVHTNLSGQELYFPGPQTGNFQKEYESGLQVVLQEDRELVRRVISPEALRTEAQKEKHLPGIVRYSVNFRGTVEWFETTVYHTKTSKNSIVYLMSKNVTSVVAAEQNAQQAEEERKRHLAELQNTQSELRAALSAAQSANVAKTQFLSNMSHDIRTPMNAIVNMTEFAIETIGKPEEQREYLQILRESSANLLNIINDVLDMSRIESGRMELNLAPVEFGMVLYGVCNIMRPLFQKKEQTFVVDYDSGGEDYVLGDQVKLSQIFVNLLNNAMKFTPSHGTICFKVHKVSSLRDDMVVFCCSVSDTGMGISEENQKKIFEPFVRSKDSKVYEIEGTGLGLPICKAFISAMSGTIRCESKPGVGSTFTVELPFTKSKPIEVDNNNPEEDVPMPFAGKRALLFEDSNINCVIAVRLLKHIGFEVDTTSDGRNGSEMFISSEPGTYDVIFMDLQMPEMDGYEATAFIRDSVHPQAKSIPIIAMTANAFAEDIERCRAAGMDGHIGKPVMVKEIVSETRRVFASRLSE